MRHFSLSLIAVFILGLHSLSAAEPIKVKLDLEPHKDWTINPMLFGSFSEEHWGDYTPGILEQYVSNPSFENWYIKREDDREPEEKSGIVWQDIPKVDGLAFPWEKLAKAGNPVVELAAGGMNTELAQRVRVAKADTSYLYQRLALPFYRVRSFNVSFYAKASGNVGLKVFMTTQSPDNRLGDKPVTALSDKWQKFEVTFHLGNKDQKEKHMGRYGIFNLGFEVSGEGCVDFDMVTLFPVDCQDGIFNPETIAHFRNYGPTMVRWPGGNFTSGYHWYDGIGKFDERKSLPNRAWGGLCTNHFGLDEFMRFCELTGIVPLMGVGYDKGVITPKEVADWVEYCNGDITTPMGKLRAENGHPEPYNVKYWGIGNEVYGPYQIGHEPDPEVYADGLIEMVKAVRKVDSTVEIIACAYGAHNRFKDPSDWNEKLIRKAGGYIDYIDVHSYVYGPRNKEMGDVKRPDVIRAFAASNFEIGKYINELRDLLKKENMEHIKLAFLEWGVLPRTRKTTRVPYRQSFANLLCTSAYFNEFIRNGDFVQMGAHHNFSFYVQPVRAHGERVNPRTLLFLHYGYMAGGKVLDMEFENMPSYDVHTNWLNIGSPKGVPEVDVMAVRKGNRVYVTLMNRNHHEEYKLNFDLSSGKIRQVRGNTYTSEKPFDNLKWQNEKEVKGHIKKNSNVYVGSDTTVSVTIPKLSYTLLTVDLQ